jgi:hypothetical protein
MLRKKMENASKVLKYIDFFGARFSFYIEKNRKLFTPFGGILTILSFFCSGIIFTYIYLDDFLHNLPNSTTSTKKESYRKIKFREEKIWIPWRIRDFGGKTINHSNILFPIIYYYKGIRNNELKSMVTSYELINYKLCNETSMVNNSDLYIIDMELDQLYCIDMEDLDIGGSWDSDFLFLITLDIYACNNGINYDENNENCTSYEKIIEFVGDNNCLEFEMYYPVVHYQPMNETTPIFVKYENYFYHLSRFSNKIDRLFLQQHILRDDRGWVLKNEEIYSRWGTASLNGDSYSTGDKKDLMNEGSTSRFYSFNIYLKPDITYYKRSYKKLHLIIADGLPIINIIFIIFRFVAKTFKISSVNQTLTELLFENLKERKSFINLYTNKSIIDKHTNRIINNFRISSQNKINKDNDISSVQLIHHDLGKKKLSPNENNSNSNDKDNKLSNLSNSIIKANSLIINKVHKEKDINRSANSIEENKSIINNNSINYNKDLFDNNSLFNNINLKKDCNSQNNKITNNKMPFNIKSKNYYLKKQLFPYKYYLFSIFKNNIDASKKSFFFTRKFIVVYNFICQLFDISSYLILQREFQTMKNTLMKEKERNIIEKPQKINVNEASFNINMRECLDGKNLSIFGRSKKNIIAYKNKKP